MKREVEPSLIPEDIGSAPAPGVLDAILLADRQTHQTRHDKSFPSWSWGVFLSHFNPVQICSNRKQSHFITKHLNSHLASKVLKCLNLFTYWLTKMQKKNLFVKRLCFSLGEATWRIRTSPTCAEDFIPINAEHRCSASRIHRCWSYFTGGRISWKYWQV